MDIRSGWYTPKEIAQIQGMPGTVQGVHKRAKREGWRLRKRLGVRGPAIEYNIFERIKSPFDADKLHEFQSSEQEQSREAQLESIWGWAFRRCTHQEQEALIEHVIAHGINSFLAETEVIWVQMMRIFRNLPESVVLQVLEICRTYFERRASTPSPPPSSPGGPDKPV